MKKVKPHKKDSLTLLGKHGDAHSAVVGNLKRCFSRSPTVRDFLRKFRREEEWFKKDGTKAKTPHVFYTCFECKKEFNSNSVQVDHIEPVVPLNIPAKHLSYDTMIRRLFCDETNLQILCKADHKKKSQLENSLRKEWLTKEKYIVYETINRVNSKKYIGVHRCIDFDEVYLGSGTALKAAIKAYGRDAFYRHILFVFDNANDAFCKEAELVNQEWIDSDKTYNLIVGGVGDSRSHIEQPQLRTPVICHETKETFVSISAAADELGISVSSVSKALDNPAATVKNYHFFKQETYDPEVVVTYPTIGRPIVHLNSRQHFTSVAEAADSLGLNYKSLRNALQEMTGDGIYSLHNDFFLFADEFDSQKEYYVTRQHVWCDGLNKSFPTLTEAAAFLKHKKPSLGGIAIGKAIRNNSKAFKYFWRYIHVKDIIYRP